VDRLNRGAAVGLLDYGSCDGVHTNTPRIKNGSSAGWLMIRGLLVRFVTTGSSANNKDCLEAANLGHVIDDIRHYKAVV
jgi:hypothetical protein